MSAAEARFREPGGPALFGLPAVVAVVIGPAVAIGLRNWLIAAIVVIVVPFVVWFCMRAPYEARIDGSGDVEFVALFRTQRVNVRDIKRIALMESVNGRSFDFYSAAGNAKMQYKSGRALALRLKSLNPSIDTPTIHLWGGCLSRMAFNGRHLLVGFASGIEAEDKGIVPRPVLFGNFSLCGVCHAYVEDPRPVKRAIGHNFPSHADGERVHARVLELTRQGRVRPVIGQEVAFIDLPSALQSMADRQTVGRVVVLVAQ